MGSRTTRIAVAAVVFSVLLMQLHVCVDWTHARSSPRDCQQCSTGQWALASSAPTLHDAPALALLAAVAGENSASQLAADEHASRAPPRA